MGKITFHSHNIRLKLSNRKLIKQFLLNLFEVENMSLSQLDYIFCSDEYLLQLNKQFLQHDYYTDIITFSLGIKSEPIIGEIYISVDRIKDNAKLLGISPDVEILRVILHGALHLCGHLDKKPDDKQAMTMKEDFYLKEFNKVSRGT